MSSLEDSLKSSDGARILAYRIGAIESRLDKLEQAQEAALKSAKDSLRGHIRDASASEEKRHGDQEARLRVLEAKVERLGGGGVLERLIGLFRGRGS